MELFMIEEEDEVVYRVKKKDEGCTIFSSSSYIEGNNILYIILKEISDYGVLK